MNRSGVMGQNIKFFLLKSYFIRCKMKLKISGPSGFQVLDQNSQNIDLNKN